jgi:pyruvate ferredoxin oxidoreductase alpha subunit
MAEVKAQTVAIDGSAAVAQAMRQINPDVVAAYPITPQTAIVEHFSQFVADGRVHTEFIPVESEHAALSACVGAAAAGGRVMTATSSQGLALMWEVIYIASSMRLPIVMPVVNRALSAPLNIHCDHSDSMGARDAGWIQIYSETPQEAYDNTVQAVRIAEHPDLLTPVMVMQDGFITSHSVERVDLNDDAAIRTFIGEYRPEYSLLDIDHPTTFGAWDFYDYYFEHKRQQTEALTLAMPVIQAVGEEYGRLFGRHYAILDTFGMEDAELAIVVLSSAAGTTRSVLRRLRAEGHKVGLVRPRVFRPFPAQALAETLRRVHAVAVLDRSVSFGTADGRGAGPLYLETAAALLAAQNRETQALDYVFGLGGRDLLPGHVEQVVADLEEVAGTGKTAPLVRYLGLRE